MNILVVRTDKLGDFITSLPAIYILKKDNPSNKIIVCVASLNEKLAKSCSFIDSVIVDNKDESVFKFANRLKTYNIDISFTLFSNTRVALAQFLANIPTRVAPATKIAQIFYNKRIKQRRSQVKMTEFEYNIDLIKNFFKNIDTTYKQPLLTFKDSKDIFKKFKQKYSISKDIIAFHVGFGGSSDANLTLDEYVFLINKVIKKGKYQVVLTFGPDEKELLKTMQKKLNSQNIIYYLSNNGVVEFAKLISNFKLFVSTSTGTYHLASAVGTKTLTFFASSLFASPKRWRSIGSKENQTNITLPTNIEKLDSFFN